METAKSKKVGCLGLSADPPHLGHLKIAKILLEKKIVDEVWLIPCFEHPLGKPLSLPKHRWRMAKFLERPGIKVHDIEFSRQGKSYTIDTVRALKERYPSFQFFWVIGSDIVKTKNYKKWKNWRKLFKEIKFLIVQREGFEVKNPSLSVKIPKISSTEIREHLKRGLSIKGLVPPEVERYIREKKLYKGN